MAHSLQLRAPLSWLGPWRHGFGSGETTAICLMKTTWSAFQSCSSKFGQENVILITDVVLFKQLNSLQWCITWCTISILDITVSHVLSLMGSFFWSPSCTDQILTAWPSEIIFCPIWSLSWVCPLPWILYMVRNKYGIVHKVLGNLLSREKLKRQADLTQTSTRVKKM